MTEPKTSVVLFDVGGVLVQLSGVKTMLEWMGAAASSDKMWRMWLESEPVRDFERGRISAEEFAAGVTAEFNLPVAPHEFLASFTGWVTGLYPGTLEMLAEIPPAYQRAVLSNSNVLHWSRVIEDLKLGPACGHQFVSHLTGRIKPDADAFEHVVRSLGCRPGEVLFLDDNTLNVEAATRFGMQAIRVEGVDEVRRALIERGIIGVQSQPS